MSTTPVYLSLARILSFFLSTQDFLSTFLCLSVYLLSPSLASLRPPPLFFCLSLFSDLSLGSGWASLLKWNVILIARLKNPHVDVSWPFMAKIHFYGHSLAEELLFVVVMTCCRVEIVLK